MVLELVLGAIIAVLSSHGQVIYVPWMFISGILAPTRSGLITTFATYTEHSKWIGYQVLFGLGLGAGMQQPNLAAQTVLKVRDVPIGISLMLFSQSFSGVILTSVRTSIFTNHLASTLSSVSDVDSEAISTAGATEKRRISMTKVTALTGRLEVSKYQLSNE